MPTTYPPPAPTVAGDQITINRFLTNPTAVARRVASLAQNRYIADALLTGRYNIEGGAVAIEGDDPLFADRDPRSVSPGAEYPLTTIGSGPLTLAKAEKWGEDTFVTDEAIKRQSMSPVERAFQKLVNTNVRLVDGLALSVIASRVTAAAGAAANWSTATAKQIFLDVALADANIVALNLGYEADTVVVDDLAWTYAMAAFIDAGYLPREAAQGAVATGDFPVIAGKRWLKTSNLPVVGAALVVDSTQLGGMADEQLGGPGYVSAGNGTSVQVKTMRDEDNDQYRLRARRVTVPVVVAPAAGRLITGVR